MSNFMTVNILEVLNVRIVHEPHMYRPRENPAPFLVLAHGFGTDQSAWQKILPSFESDYRVILYDLACAGTVNPSYFYSNSERYETLDGYVDDLLTILDALEVKQCVYVGHSVSAMIGILAAIRRRKQQLFTKLILIGASPCFKKDEDFPDGFEDAEVEEMFKAMEINYKNWTVQYAPLVVGGDLPEAIQEFSRTLFNMSPDISLFVCKQFFKCDLRGVLGLCQVPCYIIQSARDRSVPKSAANYFKDHLGARSVIRILDIEGHLPHLSSPALLAHELRRGLTRRWEVASAG